MAFWAEPMGFPLVELCKAGLARLRQALRGFLYLLDDLLGHRLFLTDRTKPNKKITIPSTTNMLVFMSVPFRRHRLSEKRGRCVPARWKANAILIVLATMSLRNMAVAEKDYRFGAMRLSSSCKLKRSSLEKGDHFFKSSVLRTLLRGHGPPP